mmetsp:Transcript_10976/g.34873  ORF Transcript_10976/g.34873 Transcript_10976/m.34873 type:complete len:202 (+) Transcript_10976:151-756(+)
MNMRSESAVLPCSRKNTPRARNALKSSGYFSTRLLYTVAASRLCPSQLENTLPIRRPTCTASGRSVSESEVRAPTAASLPPSRPAFSARSSAMTSSALALSYCPARLMASVICLRLSRESSASYRALKVLAASLGLLLKYCACPSDCRAALSPGRAAVSFSKALTEAPKSPRANWLPPRFSSASASLGSSLSFRIAACTSF